MATIWRLITQVRWLRGQCGVAPCLYKKEVGIIFSKDYPNDFRVKKNTKFETMANKVRKYGNHITLYYLQHNIPGPLINISGQLGQQALGTRYSLFCLVIVIIHFAFLDVYVDMGIYFSSFKNVKIALELQSSVSSRCI